MSQRAFLWARGVTYGSFNGINQLNEPVPDKICKNFIKLTKTQ